MAAAVLSPRPMPERRLPVLAGAAVVVFALPIFLVAGWRLEGWALGALLWAASQALGVVFARVGINAPTLRGSGFVAFGMMGRGILLALAAIVVAVADARLALSGALVYALAYTTELALGLTLYFAGEPKR